MFFTRLLRAAAHGHHDVVHTWVKGSNDAITSKGIPLGLGLAALGSVVYGAKQLLFEEGGN
jgi:hypothetical protein